MSKRYDSGGSGDRDETISAGMDAVAELAKPGMAALTSFNGAFLQNAAACQKEWLRFLDVRIKENMAMPAKLSNCRSLPEIQSVYTDYWSRAFQQYQNEMQVLTSTVLGTTGAVANMAAPPAGPSGSGTREANGRPTLEVRRPPAAHVDM